MEFYPWALLIVIAKLSLTRYCFLLSLGTNTLFPICWPTTILRQERLGTHTLSYRLLLVEFYLNNIFAIEVCRLGNVILGDDWSIDVVTIEVYRDVYTKKKDMKVCMEKAYVKNFICSICQCISWSFIKLERNNLEFVFITFREKIVICNLPKSLLILKQYICQIIIYERNCI